MVDHPAQLPGDARAERYQEQLDLYRNYVLPTYGPQLLMERGKGPYLWDVQGNKYLDFVSGIATTCLGHAHPAIRQALRVQAGKLMHVSNLYFTEPQVALARKLSRISLQGKVFFCNSGAEANEGLIKLARKWGAPQGRYEVITFRGSFHGRTLATLTATGQDKVKAGFAPLPEGFVHADFNDLASVEAAVTERTAAVLVEGIQGEGGVNVARMDFMTGLRRLCTDRGILLLMDEIQTGIGRTGRWFSYEHFGIEPDAISMAKGLGGGFPIGAFAVHPRVGDVLTAGSHGTTYGGNPLACAVALAVIETIEKKDLVVHAAKTGERFRHQLEGVAAAVPGIKGVRGLGLLNGLVFEGPGNKEVEQILVRRGLLTVATGADVIRLLPPLTISAPQLRKAARLIDKACREWHERMQKESNS